MNTCGIDQLKDICFMEEKKEFRI